VDTRSSERGLNICLNGIHGLEASNRFSADLIEKTDYQLPVLRFLYIIHFYGIKPDKLPVEYELFEDVEIMRFG
jgi:hypothetical protein